MSSSYRHTHKNKRGFPLGWSSAFRRLKRVGTGFRAFHEPNPRPRPRSRPRPDHLISRTRTSRRTIRRFMVLTHAEKIRKGAFHEPTVWCPGFSRFGPPEGGTPNKSRHTVRFRVPMHGKKAEEAFHEPEGRARQSPARRLCIAKLRRARSDAPYRFMVPMHAKKTKAGFP